MSDPCSTLCRRRGFAAGFLLCLGIAAACAGGGRQRGSGRVVRMDSIPPAATAADLPKIDSPERPVRLAFVGDLMQHEEQRNDDGSAEARGWIYARRVLGSSIVRH